MGYTHFTIGKVKTLLEDHPNILYVIDIGAQNNYDQPIHPVPYMSEWYASKGYIYGSIDISGENGSCPFDLSKPFEEFTDLMFAADMPDLIVDAGTQEHIGKEGHFDWEAIYNCMRTKHKMLTIGGYLFNENPKTGNWPGHGFNYFSKKFYWQLIAHSDYELIECDEVAAMGNTRDGWNVYAIMKKTGNRFPTLDEFKTFDLHTF